MAALKPLVKRLLEAASGLDVERIGRRSFTLVDQRHRDEAWFSYPAQMRSILERFRIDCVLDVGANEGQFAQRLRKFYSGAIHSFEPVAAVHAKLAINASSDPHWHTHHLALGSQDSTRTLHLTRDTVFSSFLEINHFGAQRFGEEVVAAGEERVTVRRFDGLPDEVIPDVASRRIFLKMDTQGYDLEVFRGLGKRGGQILAMLSEVSLISIYQGMPHWTESIVEYERAGFGVVGMFPVTRDGARVIEYDCLFIRTAMA